jgi:hypothetical protein
MKMNFCKLVLLVGVTVGAAIGTASAGDLTISAKGARLVQALDSMDVERKWAAGIHVDWKTGLPDDRPENSSGQHTHCCAFVASATEKLGVYILRPPEHGEILLANAQNEWLQTAGRFEGWHQLSGPVEAQRAANRGELVVASYHNHHNNKSGHIAIIRPSGKSIEQVLKDGPDAIMASTINRTSISVRDGFAGHPSAWGNNEIVYYAHDIPTILR